MLSSMPMLGGVRLAPLPVSVLPSTMVVREPAGEDEYGGSCAEPYEIAHVRFSAASEFTLQQSGGAQAGYVFAEGAKGVIYVDAANSSPAREVPERSVVTVDDGEPMMVRRVTRCDHLDGSCHHWELEVS